MEWMCARGCACACVCACVCVCVCVVGMPMLPCDAVYGDFSGRLERLAQEGPLFEAAE